MWVKVPAGTSKVIVPPETEPVVIGVPQVMALRAYAGDPPVTSLVPVVPGSAVCSEPKCALPSPLVPAAKMAASIVLRVVLVKPAIYVSFDVLGLAQAAYPDGAAIL